jgi:hypothetical protein
MHWARASLKEMKELHIQHPFYFDALMSAYTLIHACEKGEVILIIGPSRVGKTRLAWDLRRMIHSELANIPAGHLPVIYVQVKNNATNGTFSTKAFKRRMLRTLKHPFFNYEGDLDSESMEFLRRIQIFTEDTMDDAFELSLKHRHTELVIIDEAGHFRYLRSKKQSPEQVVDSFKSSAQESKYVLVLVGDYTLPAIVRSSAHLLGRTSTVHFPRYRWEIAEEQFAFHQLLDACGKHIQLPKDVSSLCEWGALLYKGSLGCTGHLSHLLRRAIAQAWKCKSDCLEKSHIEYALRAAEDQLVLTKHVAQGETELSRPPLPPLRPPVKRPEESKPKRSKPFQSNPRRHPVGDQAEVDA